MVQQLLPLQPKWTIHLWCCGERLAWSVVVYFQKSFPLPQVHRDEDALHLTQHTMCASVLINDMQVCVAFSRTYLQTYIITD